MLPQLHSQENHSFWLAFVKALLVVKETNTPNEKVIDRPLLDQLIKECLAKAVSTWNQIPPAPAANRPQYHLPLVQHDTRRYAVVNELLDLCVTTRDAESYVKLISSLLHPHNASTTNTFRYDFAQFPVDGIVRSSKAFGFRQVRTVYVLRI